MKKKNSKRALPIPAIKILLDAVSNTSHGIGPGTDRQLSGLKKKKRAQKEIQIYIDGIWYVTK